MLQVQAEEIQCSGSIWY